MPDEEAAVEPDAPPPFAVFGYEAALKGSVLNGKSEFVMARSNGLPLRVSLQAACTDGSAEPLLVGEAKPSASFDTNIWQPLAYALELLESSASPDDLLWVLLTDMTTWEFVRITHKPRGSSGGEPPGVPPLSKRIYTLERGETLFANLRDPLKSGADILKLVSFLYSLVFPGRSPSEQRELKAASDRYLEEKATEWIERALAERKQQKAEAEAKAAAQKAEAEAKAAAQKAEAEAAAQKAEAKALAAAMHAVSEAAAQVIAKMEEVKEKEGKFARNEITEQELAAATAELLAVRQEYEAKMVARDGLQAAQKAAEEVQLQGEERAKFGLGGG
ncbi:hypothetical protein GPECTOR_1g313 [Gonium pectorale]|uniref:Uncharacterized protein n=1 Tax=Gonium pectorale TaxID=33097 RepID=A0A150H2U8_GONPE|nr:hypothetical protein GPECTOR_1g313 [Gonium pectorale]|eukprot:KXZ56354.1 hypothetical protein GPECTOR_1g313 [Gonium pectorale]